MAENYTDIPYDEYDAWYDSEFSSDSEAEFPDGVDEEKKSEAIDFDLMIDKMEKFKELLALKENFQTRGRIFYFRYYIDQGYEVTQEYYTIYFIYDEEFAGSLIDEANRKIRIYHNGGLGYRLGGNRPSFCGYHF